MQREANGFIKNDSAAE